MKKSAVYLILIVLALTLIGCSSEPTSDEDLIQLFERKVLLDFENQQIVGDIKKANSKAQEIYVEPALSEYKESLQLMLLNDVKRVYNPPEFKNTQVIQNDKNTAILKVNIFCSGTEFSISSPTKNLGVFEYELIAEVMLKNVKGDWFISEMKTVPQ